MKNFCIVTEGQSETNFVNRVMVPYFAGRCTLIPITVVTKIDSRHGKTYKGGVGNYGQIRNTLLMINDGAETAPLKWIMDCIGSFDKANVGVDVLRKIGIENIAGKCRHFAEWLQCIEERF